MVPLPVALVLADTGKGGEVVVEVFENERWSPASGWNAPTSYVTAERGHFSNEDGAHGVEAGSLEELTMPETLGGPCEWLDKAWRLDQFFDIGGDKSEGGWSYALEWFFLSKGHAEERDMSSTGSCFVRRRRWLRRLRRLTPIEVEDLPNNYNKEGKGLPAAVAVGDAEAEARAAREEDERMVTTEGTREKEGTNDRIVGGGVASSTSIVGAATAHLDPGDAHKSHALSPPPPSHATQSLAEDSKREQQRNKGSTHSAVVEDLDNENKGRTGKGGEELVKGSDDNDGNDEEDEVAAEVTLRLRNQAAGPFLGASGAEPEFSAPLKLGVALRYHHAAQCVYVHKWIEPKSANEATNNDKDSSQREDLGNAGNASPEFGGALLGVEQQSQQLLRHAAAVLKREHPRAPFVPGLGDLVVGVNGISLAGRPFKECVALIKAESDAEESTQGGLATVRMRQAPREKKLPVSSSSVSSSSSKQPLVVAPSEEQAAWKLEQRRRRDEYDKVRKQSEAGIAAPEASATAARVRDAQATTADDTDASADGEAATSGSGKQQRPFSISAWMKTKTKKEKAPKQQLKNQLQPELKEFEKSSTPAAEVTEGGERRGTKAFQAEPLASSSSPPSSSSSLPVPLSKGVDTDSRNKAKNKERHIEPAIVDNSSLSADDDLVVSLEDLSVNKNVTKTIDAPPSSSISSSLSKNDGDSVIEGGGGGNRKEREYQEISDDATSSSSSSSNTTIASPSSSFSTQLGFDYLAQTLLGTNITDTTIGSLSGDDQHNDSDDDGSGADESGKHDINDVNDDGGDDRERGKGNRSSRRLSPLYMAPVASQVLFGMTGTLSSAPSSPKKKDRRDDENNDDRSQTSDDDSRSSEDNDYSRSDSEMSSIDDDDDDVDEVEATEGGLFAMFTSVASSLVYADSGKQKSKSLTASSLSSSSRDDENYGDADDAAIANNHDRGHHISHHSTRRQSFPQDEGSSSVPSPASSLPSLGSQRSDLLLRHSPVVSMGAKSTAKNTKKGKYRGGSSGRSLDSNGGDGDGKDREDGDDEGYDDVHDSFLIKKMGRNSPDSGNSGGSRRVTFASSLEQVTLIERIDHESISAQADQAYDQRVLRRAKRAAAHNMLAANHDDNGNGGRGSSSRGRKTKKGSAKRNDMRGVFAMHSSSVKRSTRIDYDEDDSYSDSEEPASKGAESTTKIAPLSILV